MNPVTESKDLQGWLRWLEQLHPSTIDLGLERVQQVMQRMSLDFGATQIVIVGGTNGKGSTVAMLGNILLAAGHTVGSYTSPHLLTYNERVCYNGKPVDDAALCSAFAAIEAVRGDVSLTYFEFGTLAALHYFASRKPDFMILEVGLGGRLDAVNIMNPDISILTNVALDHMDWLGTTREQIGFEKAGIFRTDKYAIFGESDMPDSVRNHAQKISARLLHNTEHYQWQSHGATWSWHGLSGTGEQISLQDLPQVPFPLDNAAGVIQALQCLNGNFTVEHIREGLSKTTLPGRFQSVEYKGQWVILDVAHNPHAAANLVRNIQTRLAGCEVQLVLGMLADKDSSAVVQLLAPVVTHIHAATLQGERGSPAKILYNHAQQAGMSAVTCHESVTSAFAAACAASGAESVVVVTGSFFTVAAVLELI
ncbi:MAG: bifunctional tetrahydrofolate synthase/dihydrofolate synthase [Pseudomonadota bacterium]